MLIFFPAFFAFVVASVTTFIIIKIAPLLGIVDIPGKRKHPANIHTHAVARGGGIPLFLAILASSLVFLPLEPRLAAILFGAFIIVLLGFLDDKWDISPYWRLLGQIGAAVVVVFSGVSIHFATNPLGGIFDFSKTVVNINILGQEYSFLPLAIIFGVLWIVFFANAVSWSSGVDGQLSGVVVIASLVIAFLSLRFWPEAPEWPVAILAFSTAGAFLGFLPWHIYPQKIMPGFGGATLAGYMLAVLSILATAKVGALLVVLGIPVIDALYVILRRVVQGRSPVWADRGHLHHRLLDLGWSKQRVTFFYWIATLLLGILALNLNSQHKFYTIVGVSIIVGIFLLWISSFRLSKQQGRDSGLKTR